MTDPAAVSDYCLFRRDQADYAISTRFVREVLEARPYTPVPCAPPDLLGALNLRGEVIALVHLDALLGRPRLPLARSGRLLVLGSDDLAVAVVVDSVRDVRHWPPWQVKRSETGPRDGVVRGQVTQDGEAITVLDGDRLVAALVSRIVTGFGRRPVGPGAPPASRAEAAPSSATGENGGLTAEASLPGGNPT